ncbi:MAG TPA: glycosyltransferase family 4 protein [Alphaproteobacteria bacterium]|nr:glycosyltransferase family 4 protein [Alphaproteobacteria bacterium]
MKIAEIAPVLESVPPRLYGGTERVISYLTEALVAQGHDVTLFASGDSVTRAKLVPLTERALWHDPEIANTWPHQVMAYEPVLARAHEFDVLHFHTELLQFPMLGPELRRRAVTTLHYRLDDRDLVRFFTAYDDMHLITISMSHAAWLGDRPRVTTIYHGLPPDLLPFEPRPAGDYLVFLGRTSPDKGIDRAIEIAVRAGMTLKIAAKIDAADRPFWNEVVEPMIRAHRNVEYLGEVGDADKARLLGNARALLFPIDWPEPFGLAMIEAMSCGTPVIARPCGAVPEIVENGISGFLVANVEEGVEAVGRLDTLDRRTVRRAFESRFTAADMAAAHVRLFERIAQRSAEARFARAK